MKASSYYDYTFPTMPLAFKQVSILHFTNIFASDMAKRKRISAQYKNFNFISTIVFKVNILCELMYLSQREIKQ